MNSQTKISPSMLDPILTRLAALPEQTIGEHLNDDDCAAYVLECCTSAQLMRIERHIESCPECAAHLEWLYECEPFWNRVQAAKPAKSMSLAGRNLGKFAEQLGAWAKQCLQPPALALAKSEAPECQADTLKFYTADGQKKELSYTMELQGDRMLLRFSSEQLDCGREIVITLGDKQIKAHLEPFAGRLYGEVSLGADTFTLDTIQIDWQFMTDD